MILFIFAWLCFCFGFAGGCNVLDLLPNHYRVYSCTKSGTVSFSREISARVLVVGPGGNGGSGKYGCVEGGGGGGAGQFLEAFAVNFKAGVPYTVTVDSKSSSIQSGSNTYTAIKGGDGADANSNAGTGASGGGGNGCFGNRDGGTSLVGILNHKRGNSGGAGVKEGPGGGGGGAGGAGFIGSSTSDGDGGVGKQWSVNGVYYAAGGGGGYSRFNAESGEGGSSIGGNGGTTRCASGSNAAANTGSGGGGGGGDCGSGSPSPGGSGSSGIVLIAFIECQAGYYAQAESCSQCPAGKSSSYGDNICSICSAGKYSSAGAAQCSDCVAGKFSNSEGSATCSDCGTGRFSYVAASSCKNCPENTYIQSIGGPEACKTCPDGTFSVAGSKACATCQDGYYSISGEKCQWCGAIGNPTLAFDEDYRWVGGPTRQECRCEPGFSQSSNCLMNECGTNADIPGMSLGSLLMNSDIQLRTYSDTLGAFAKNPMTQDQKDRLSAAYGYLYNLLAIDVDVDGDSNITRSEVMDALRFRQVSIANSDSIPLWCRKAVAGNCLNLDVVQVQVKDIYSDALKNFNESVKHTFDGSGVAALSQFTATYPRSSWSKDTCQKYDQSISSKPLRVSWTLSPPQSTSINLVCAFVMSSSSPEYSKTDEFTVRDEQSFMDYSTISSYKRMYCVRVVTESAESVECIPGISYVSY